MTKQLKDLVLSLIKESVTEKEFYEVKMILEDYDDMLRDNLELQQKLAEWE